MIEETIRRLGGNTKRVQVVRCAHCKAILEIPVKSRRKPPSVIDNMAKRRGWKVTKIYTCPEHS